MNTSLSLEIIVAAITCTQEAPDIMDVDMGYSCKFIYIR